MIDPIEREVFELHHIQILLDQAFTRMGEGWMEPTGVYLSMEQYMDLIECRECDKRYSYEHGLYWYQFRQFKIPVFQTNLEYTLGVHWRQVA